MTKLLLFITMYCDPSCGMYINDDIIHLVNIHRTDTTELIAIKEENGTEHLIQIMSKPEETIEEVTF